MDSMVPMPVSLTAFVQANGLRETLLPDYRLWRLRTVSGKRNWNITGRGKLLK